MKKSITCKGIEYARIEESITSIYTPRMGDVALFEVIELGKHSSIQSTTGNNCYLFEGDQFLATFGNRYATEQFEGYIPDTPTLELDILGKGGVVGIMKSMHYKFKDIGTTKVKLIGYAVDNNNKVLNSIYHNKERVKFQPELKPANSKIILSLGCSMDSGKTTSAAYLSRSLMLQGKKVAFIKLTGTHYTKDSHFVRDCGAEMSIDFGYAGYPSTYLVDVPTILDLYQYLLNKVSKIDPDYIIVEIADGILQRETRALLNHHAFKSTIDYTFFSAVDSLSAIFGIEQLSQLNLRPFAVGGLFTASPLLHKEVADLIDIPVVNLDGILALTLTVESNKVRLRA